MFDLSKGVIGIGVHCNLLLRPETNTLTAIHKMGSLEPDVDIDNVLSKLTIEEKVALLAAKDWWRTPSIKRDDVFVPQIKVCALWSCTIRTDPNRRSRQQMGQTAPEVKAM